MLQYVLITGGELRNRGAQAMTFRAVQAVRELFPEFEPVVASVLDAPPGLTDRLRGKKRRVDADNIAFTIVRTAFDALQETSRWRHSSPMQRAKDRVKRLAYASQDAEFSRVLDNTALCLDISGYALGMQWGAAKCWRYLDKLSALHERSIPTYLMPQSFGPFYYDGQQPEPALLAQLSESLAWPRLILCRERQGLHEILASCPQANAQLSEDLVLQGQEIDLTCVFRDPSLIPAQPGLSDGPTVGIVPNARTFEHGGDVSVLALWGIVVDELLRLGYKVAIIRHSEDDRQCCRMVKTLFLDDARVSLYEADRYCFQYEELFSGCDFLVGSRFHSIVHSYRCGVPCVVLGWATKYEELCVRLGQGAFVHDVCDANEAVVGSILNSIRTMAAERNKQSLQISACLEQLQATPSAFELVHEDFRSLS